MTSSEYFPSPAILRVKTLLGGAEEAIALAPTSVTAGPVLLRGLYCVSVSGLEVYFTYVSTDVMFDRFFAASKDANPNRLEELRSSYKSELRSLGCNKPRASEPDVTELRSAIYGDFSSVTINRAKNISRCMDLLGPPGGSSSHFWQAAALQHGRYQSRDFMELVNLVVERRNRIMHYGDFELLGGQTQISVETAREAVRCVNAITASADRLLCGRPRS